MADKARAGRMAKRIQAIVATALERRLGDPITELITVTDCRVTGDLHDATVFYTVRGRTLGAKPSEEAAAEFLEKKRGMLRKLVGEDLSVRFTPTLAFELDHVLEEVLARARARDEELERSRSGARHAGDANPYKTEDEES